MRKRQKFRPKQKAPLPIEEVMSRFYPREADRPLVRAQRAWQHAVPERVDVAARPARLLRGGVLIVHCVNSMWVHELSYLEEQFRERMKAGDPRLRLRKIRFVPGPLPERAPPLPHPKAPPPPLPAHALPPRVAAAIARVQDPKLQDALVRAACQSLAPLDDGPTR